MVNCNTDAAISNQRQVWKEIALSVSPANREGARAAARHAYRVAGLTPPRCFLWFASPAAGLLAAATLSSQSTSLHAEVVQKPKELSAAKFYSQIKTMPSSEWWQNAAVELSMNRTDRLYQHLPDSLRLALNRWLLSRMEGWHRPDFFQSVMEQLSQQVPATVAANLPYQLASVNDAVVHLWRAGHGCHNAHWLQLFDFARCAGIKLPQLEGLIGMAKTCGWWWPFADCVILTDRPKAIGLDQEGRLHNPRGPAAEYRDGWRVWSWHGNFVPDRVIQFTRNMSAFDIEHEPNVEVRRFMIEIMGLERFILSSNARKMHEDECGILFRKELRDDEPIMLVQVINSTPEPDGRYKKYFLRVPPTMRTAREAVAWTFNLRPGDYRPCKQT